MKLPEHRVLKNGKGPALYTVLNSSGKMVANGGIVDGRLTVTFIWVGRGWTRQMALLAIQGQR